MASSSEKEYDDIESGMDFAEHQRVVVAARSLLANDSNAASGWGDSDDDKAAKAAFTDLKTCCETSTSPNALYITKCIQERATNAHMQLVLSVPGSGKWRTFHLNVTATLENVDRSAGPARSSVTRSPPSSRRKKGFCNTADRKLLYGGTSVPMKVKKTGAMKTLTYNPDSKTFTLT